MEELRTLLDADAPLRVMLVSATIPEPRAFGMSLLDGRNPEVVQQDPAPAGAEAGNDDDDEHPPLLLLPPEGVSLDDDAAAISAEELKKQIFDRLRTYPLNCRHRVLALLGDEVRAATEAQWTSLRASSLAALTRKAML